MLQVGLLSCVGTVTVAEQVMVSPLSPTNVPVYVVVCWGATVALPVASVLAIPWSNEALATCVVDQETVLVAPDENIDAGDASILHVGVGVSSTFLVSATHTGTTEFGEV